MLCNFRSVTIEALPCCSCALDSRTPKPFFNYTARMHFRVTPTSSVPPTWRTQLKVYRGLSHLSLMCAACEHLGFWVCVAHTRIPAQIPNPCSKLCVCFLFFCDSLSFDFLLCWVTLSPLSLFLSLSV